MGVAIGDARQRVDYRYDTESKTLDLTLTLSSPGIANLALEAEVHPFDPKAPVTLDKLHVDQLSADYADLGYLQRRNKFCGQQASIGPGQFAEQHAAAVQALLQQHGIQAGSELMKLYRHLVETGGHASVLSLPNSNFVAGTGLTLGPEDLLRQLNVTARYEDTPPVMFRLSFAAPADTETAAAVTQASGPDPTPMAAPNLAGMVPTPGLTQPITTTTAPPAVPASATPAASTPAASAAHVPADKTDAVSNAAPKPAPSTSLTNASSRPREPNLGLSELDRAEARLPPPPKPLSSRTTPDFLPSTPPPPPGSTLALVWKPTIERLAPTSEYRDYDVIEFARLKDEQGRRVRLITEGGKKVEGYVIAADEAGVELRINGGGGGAQFMVPKTRIQEVQLLHRFLPPA
jgi:hypothetical protein